MEKGTVVASKNVSPSSHNKMNQEETIVKYIRIANYTLQSTASKMNYPNTKKVVINKHTKKMWSLGEID